MFQLFGLLIVGLVIGALARLLTSGRQRLGFLGTMALGVVGAVIGGALADLLGLGSILELNFWGFVFAVVAAVLLVGVAEGVVDRRHVRSRASAGRR